MELTYLGTAASEAIPAVWCQCAACELARNEKHGVRCRAGAVISTGGEPTVMLDLPPDAYLSSMLRGVRLSEIRDLFFTHSHSDHCTPFDLQNRADWVMCKRKAGPDDALRVYGGGGVMRKLESTSGRGIVKRELKPFESVVSSDGKLKLTALLAQHMPDEACFIYLISDGERTLLYAHDTGLLPDESLEFLRGKRLDCVSIDCTNVLLDGERGHMGIKADQKQRKILESLGITGQSTRWIANHFSHNGFFRDGAPISTEWFEEYCGSLGFEAAYDGMKVII